MKLRSRVTGTDKLERRLKRIAQKDATPVLIKAGEFLRTECVKAISRGGRSGRIYKRGKRFHIASAPGEYPKTDTGELVANITVENERGIVTVGSRAQAPQGYYLELKSPSEGGRPWLKPTVDKNRAKIQSIIRKGLSALFKR